MVSRRRCVRILFLQCLVKFLLNFTQWYNNVLIDRIAALDIKRWLFNLKLMCDLSFQRKEILETLQNINIINS